MSAFKDSGHFWWQQCQRCRQAWFVGNKPKDVDEDLICRRCDADDLRVITARAEGFARAREMALGAIRDEVRAVGEHQCTADEATAATRSLYNVRSTIRAMQDEGAHE